jgi:hypothetical protein
MKLCYERNDWKESSLNYTNILDTMNIGFETLYGFKNSHPCSEGDNSGTDNNDIKKGVLCNLWNSRRKETVMAD